MFWGGAGTEEGEGPGRAGPVLGQPGGCNLAGGRGGAGLFVQAPGQVPLPPAAKASVP